MFENQATFIFDWNAKGDALVVRFHSGSPEATPAELAYVWQRVRQMAEQGKCARTGRGLYVLER